MICNTEQQIKDLIAKGKKENIDFRIVHFGTRTEVKIIKK